VLPFFVLLLCAFVIVGPFDEVVTGAQATGRNVSPRHRSIFRAMGQGPFPERFKKSFPIPEAARLPLQDGYRMVDGKA
jgi:hypothetical protein